MTVQTTYLPENDDQRKSRVHDLINEMRRPDLAPCRGFLYQRDADGNLSACIEGIVNEMAIRNGLPALWVEMKITEDDDKLITIWEVQPPTLDGTEPAETSNAALPEALLYHGFNMPDGRLEVDILDCDPDFIQTVINERHGTSFGADYGAILNDKLIRQGANPLLVAADMLEHLLERPNLNMWHSQINQLEQ